MSDSEGIKTFLYSYVNSKRRVSPQYTFIQQPSGRGSNRQICELRVETFDYVGIGNSTNKKDAQTNAARDFVSYLVREGFIPASSVPGNQSQTEVPKIETATDIYPSSSNTNSFSRTEPTYNNQMPNSTEKNSTRDDFDDKELEQAEEVDLTADIHGGWSLENSKSRLNEYLTATRQNITEPKYSPIGPDHNRSFVAEMTVFSKKMRKSLYSRECGSTKQMASRACSLSLVRQLFHSGEIEKFTGEKKKKKNDEVPPIAVSLDPKIERKISSLLEALKINPPVSPPDNIPVDQPYSMIASYNLAEFEEIPQQTPRSVPWCPPIPNWNPWTGCNIDEGPMSSKSLAEISTDLTNDLNRRKQVEPQMRVMMEERSKLPVFPYRKAIIDSIQNNPVTLIRGETGCGKTTQIPQFILDSFIESGKGGDCSVLVTQPRRISAVSLAERIASERCEIIGDSVGYSVRFETALPRPYGSILFCTVGTLVRKLEGGIRGVSHLIVDEIHERDVNTDFLLILLREMIQTNRDLRVILMSATVDTSMYMEYFGSCNVLDIEGRMHPVKYFFLEDCIKMLNYAPPPFDERKRKKRLEKQAMLEEANENCHAVCGSEYGDRVANSLREIHEKEVPFDLIGSLLEHVMSMNISGSVLIFLPGWNVISLLRKYLQTHPRFGGPEFLILPLHSQIPREDQRLVFRKAPDGVTKLVLSTNIAESSITINDVVFVIDFCLSRMKMFTARNNLTSFSTTWASRTNLEQRRGRAGRVRPGFAFHLCSRARFDRLEQHSVPEILRTPLHDLALMIKLLRLGSVSELLKKAIQPPPLDAVIEAEFTLQEMKAFDKNGELTPLGSILAHLPIEPRLGRMLILSCAFNLGGATAVLAATASLDVEPFMMPPERRRLSHHQRSFSGKYASDHLAGLNIFQIWSAENHRHGEEAADLLCERNEFNGPGLSLMDDAGNQTSQSHDHSPSPFHHPSIQLRSIMLKLSFPESSVSDQPIDFNMPNNIDCDTIASLLTMGLYPNVSYHSEKRKLMTIDGAFALIHKGSVNCENVSTYNNKTAHPFYVFNEKIRTQAVACKSLTMVNPFQLMLFGCRTAVWTEGPDGDADGLVKLDDWIPLRMSFAAASRLFALRPALDALLVRVCVDPGTISELEETDKLLIDITRQLCSLSTTTLHDDDESEGPSKYFSSDHRYPLLKGRKRFNDSDRASNYDRGFDRYANKPENYCNRAAYQQGRGHYQQRPWSSYGGNHWQPNSVANNQSSLEFCQPGPDMQANYSLYRPNSPQQFQSGPFINAYGGPGGKRSRYEQRPMRPYRGGRY